MREYMTYTALELYIPKALSLCTEALSLVVDMLYTPPFRFRFRFHRTLLWGSR